jgi:hypothetical protein
VSKRTYLRLLYASTLAADFAVMASMRRLCSGEPVVIEVLAWLSIALLTTAFIMVARLLDLASPGRFSPRNVLVVVNGEPR